VLHGLRRWLGGLGGRSGASEAPAPHPDAPFAVLHTPESVPASPPKTAKPFYIGQRGRLATCGGVAWFHGLHLATLNLLGEAVRTYAFDPSTRSFSLLQTLDRRSGLVRPENLAFSHDGALLAVTNSIDGSVNLFGVDRRSHAVDPSPLATIACGLDVNPHGVGFSPWGHLIFTTVEDPGSIRCFGVGRDAAGRLRVELVQEVENRFGPLKPKAIAVAPDGRFVAVSYGPNARPFPAGAQPGFLAVFPFDAERGLRMEPASTRGPELGLICPEDLSFLPDGSGLAVVDHMTDSVVMVEYGGADGALGATTRRRVNPHAQVSFPHGASVSEDGRFLAVANYGDDTVTVYELCPTSGD
jgi:6-phosphogluconolactonase (cycloisomerase 2 family)